MVLTPQPEGGFVITSPLLPELITEIDTLDELWPMVFDALETVKEIYEDEGRILPIETLGVGQPMPMVSELLLPA